MKETVEDSLRNGGWHGGVMVRFGESIEKWIEKAESKGFQLGISGMEGFTGVAGGLLFLRFEIPL